MPKMGVNPEQTKAPKPVPGGWYKLRVKALTANKSKSGKGINYQAITEVTESTAENNGSTVFVRINNGFKQAMTANDFTHSTGLLLEKDGSFPGDWVLKDGVKGPDANGNYTDKEGKALDELSAFDGAQYKGPILGKVLEAELAVDNYDGQDRNEVKQFRCKINNCAQQFPDIRHQTDIRGKK